MLRSTASIRLNPLTPEQMFPAAEALPIRQFRFTEQRRSQDRQAAIWIQSFESETDWFSHGARQMRCFERITVVPGADTYCRFERGHDGPHEKHPADEADPQESH